MKSTVFALCALIVMVSACGQKDASGDKNRLDSFVLGRAALYSIETKRYEGTNLLSNVLDDESAKRVVAALSESNRIEVQIPGKQRFVAWVEFYYGTNYVTRIFISDKDAFHYGNYDFRLKTPLPVRYY